MLQTNAQIREMQGLQLVSNLAWQYLLVNKFPVSDGVLSAVCYKGMGPCSDWASSVVDEHSFIK